jgi:hypothetical protein
MIPGVFAGAAGSGGGSESPWNDVLAALNPWGWWKLDETSGNGITAIDSSGSGHDGEYTASGSQGSGLFAGSIASQTTIGGRINLPTYTTSATPQFTVGAFISSTSTSSEAQILSADGIFRLWQFRMSSSKIQFVTIIPSVTTTASSSSVNDGNPHMVIVVFDQTLAGSSGRVKIYIDGSLDVASTTDITITGIRDADPAIGTRHNASVLGLWPGQIDECFLIDGPITGTDVSDLWLARDIT